MPDVATVSSNVRLPQLPQELQHRDSDDEDQSNKGRKQNLRQIDAQDYYRVRPWFFVNKMDPKSVSGSHFWMDLYHRPCYRLEQEYEQNFPSDSRFSHNPCVLADFATHKL